MKVCSKCKLEKMIDDFCKSKTSKDGHIGTCKECRSISLREYRMNKVYSDDEISKIKEKKKEYYIKNKDLILDKAKEYRDNNKDKAKEYKKYYYENNRDKLIKYSSDYHLNRLKNDQLYKFSCNIRNLIKLTLKSKGYKKGTKTEDILGIEIDKFLDYISSKFEPWMNWSNYGLYNGELDYGWDIDHIIPISSAKDEEEVLQLNHYLNLQPLCSKINRDIKCNKIDFK